jgi:putative nucleotidyltransferase with HDIG domain
MNNLQIIELTKFAGKLKRIKRTGWVNQGVKNAESVAEHSYRVAFIAMILASKYKLDVCKLMKMGLIHDIGEAITGDIVVEQGNAIVSSTEIKINEEMLAIEKIFGKEPAFQEYTELFKEYIKQETVEAKFLKEIDKFEMAAQALEYQEEGNPAEKLVQFWENTEKYLKNNKLEGLFYTLKDLR